MTNACSTVTDIYFKSVANMYVRIHCKRIILCHQGKSEIVDGVPEIDDLDLLYP